MLLNISGNTINELVSNSLNTDQVQHSICPDLDPNCLQRLSADNKSGCFQGKSYGFWCYHGDNDRYSAGLSEEWVRCFDASEINDLWWASAWDFQQCGMCDQQSLRSACAYAQSDQSLCCSLGYSMIVKLLTEHHLEFLSLKGGCTGSSESTLVKMSNCWKSHALALMSWTWRTLSTLFLG